MPKADVPDLTKKQGEFLELYYRLQSELGRAPSQLELGEACGRFAPGSERAGAQRMLDTLGKMGLVEPPVMKPVGGGITKLGLRALKRHQKRE